MNPELRRNLWLEITTHRLLAMPVVLGLTFLALAAIDKPNAAAHLNWLALVGFGLLTALWGSRLAGNAILDEITDKTWDWQRLSILSPWTMMWGKLFGATAFSWYGGLICLGVFLATASSSAIRSPYLFGMSVILLAIMFHAGTIAAALHISRAKTTVNRRAIGILPLVLLLYVVPFVVAKAWDSRAAVNWYGVDFDNLGFLLASSAAFAVWAVVGAWRSMCQSLAVRTAPWAWLMFLLFVTAYSAGHFVSASTLATGLTALVALSMAGLISGLLLTYVMLFTEPTGPIVLRRLMRKASQRQWTRAWQELPCWLVALIYAALCALILTVNGIDSANSAWRELAILPIPAVLRAVRDAAIFLFFAAAVSPRRVVGTTIVYMVLLDWILPTLLRSLGFTQLAAWLSPYERASFWAPIVSALVQAVIAGCFAYRRMQVNFLSCHRVGGW